MKYQILEIIKRYDIKVFNLWQRDLFTYVLETNDPIPVECALDIETEIPKSIRVVFERLPETVH